MNAPQTALLNHIIDDLNETYKKFLEDKGLDDTSVVRIGFFATVQEIIINTPLPDEEVQASVIKYVTDSQIVSMTEYMDEVEFLLMDVIRARKPSR